MALTYKIFCIISLFSIIINQGTNAVCPKIITRSQWGSRKTNLSRLPTVPAPYVVIHHTAIKECTSDKDCRQQMRNLQNYHINGNKWADIGYNFLIGNNGLVYEGRGWRKQGAHAINYNSKSIGISFMGTFTNKLPTTAALNAAKKLIKCGVAKNEIKKSYSVVGHRQVYNTQCPGNKLFAEMKKKPGLFK